LSTRIFKVLYHRSHAFLNPQHTLIYKYLFSLLLWHVCSCFNCLFLGNLHNFYLPGFFKYIFGDQGMELKNTLETTLSPTLPPHLYS
jgi:hypothetical protein